MGMSRNWSSFNRNNSVGSSNVSVDGVYHIPSTDWSIVKVKRHNKALEEAKMGDKEAIMYLANRSKEDNKIVKEVKVDRSGDDVELIKKMLDKGFSLEELGYDEKEYQSLVK